MKLVSFFTKTPRHQVFSYSPRYYNPRKEEAKEREARIRGEVEEQEAQKEQAGSYRTRMMGSFKTARMRESRSASGASKATPLIRLGVILILVLSGIAYLTWGRVALYGFVFFIPLYIYFKFKQR